MSIDESISRERKSRRNLIVAAMVATLFIASYAYANASRGGGASLRPAFDTTGAYGAADGGADAYGGGSAGGGCGAGGGGCCGGSGETIEGTTTEEGGVQRIAVDTSQGSFNPNAIKAKAGVPIEIEFSQAPGGCLSGVLFADFDIAEDLTAGPKTVKLPALQPGEYAFSCQMNMVTGTLIVE